MTTAPVTMPTATPPLVKALVDKVSRRGDRRGGVIGVRALPRWDGPAELTHAGLQVAVRPCVSALAVREALAGREPDTWLVVLTDRDERDLGTGITAHLAGQRLRSPDPWDAVRDRFAATRVDHRLVKAARGVAEGLVAAGTDRRWPPARGGLLTYEHALGAVAAAWLGLGGTGSRDDAVDVTTVLAWTTRPESTSEVAALRAAAGDPLADAVLAWLSDRCGSAQPIVAQLLSRGRQEDVVPLGLAARAVLAGPSSAGPWALLRHQLGVSPTEDQVQAYAAATESVTAGLLGDDHMAGRVLARADALVTALEADGGASASTLLRSGLLHRLESLGEALRRAAEHAESRAAASGVDAPLVDPDLLSAVETAWRGVEDHALARDRSDARVARAQQAVRLLRWLGTEVPPVRGLAGAVGRWRHEGAWVDRAYADAWNGVGEPALADGFRAVLAAVRLRRDAHDLAFGAALAAAAEPLPRGVVMVEELMARVVVPLARRQPVLLVVADGMSGGVGTEVVDDLGRHGSWLECVPAGRRTGFAALAALPSLTQVSRASLLSGTLTVGQQRAERDGFASLTRTADVRGVLFHKLTMDSSAAGHDLAHDVGAAVDDVAGLPLVACVLNTVDDALDRSDPGGTDWTADAVKHLRPLLERARSAGRLVVLTSDHGHVVERREGRTLSVGPTSSNRSRPAQGGPPGGEGEVRVTGPRVLQHDGDAVLAVDERLRYGPLKAGYHGGGSPAEVVIPVHVLTSGEPPEEWVLAPPQSPSWWRGAAGVQLPTSVTARLPARPPRQSDDGPTLFDEEPALLQETETSTVDLVSAVLASPVYRDQRSRAARTALADDRVAALLRVLAGAPANRVGSETAAAALGVAVVQLSGALPTVQRLLNVEQYPVLERDPDGATVVLDVELLREQFGVG